MIKPRVESEYGRLRTVIMCMANPYDLDFEDLPADLVDEALIHQHTHNDHRPYDVARVREQQKALVNVIERNGGEVLFARPLGAGVAQHYTRDVGFTIRDVCFRARPRREYRRRELEGLEPLRDRIAGWHNISPGSIEGGDVLVDADHVLIGLGEETTPEAIDEVEAVLQAREVDLPVRRLTFRRRGVIHTDTLFNIIAPETAIIERSCFFDEDIAWLAKRYRLIDATPEEARGLAVNTLALAPDKLVMLSPGGRLADAVSALGIEPVLIDYSEVTALPGSFRCTTFPVLRE
jgi:N-dimethylarginine dimethylaminohydrolase